MISAEMITPAPGRQPLAITSHRPLAVQSPKRKLSVWRER
jgi:hypothetical protein